MPIRVPTPDEVSRAASSMQYLVSQPPFDSPKLCDMDRFTSSDAFRNLVRCWLSTGDKTRVYMGTVTTLFCLHEIACRSTDESPIASRIQALQEHRESHGTFVDACMHLKAAAELLGLPRDYYLEYPQPVWVHPSGGDDLLKFTDMPEGHSIRSKLAFYHLGESLLEREVAVLPNRSDVSIARQAVRDLILATQVSEKELKNKRLFKSYAKTIQTLLEFADLDVAENIIRAATDEAYAAGAHQPATPNIENLKLNR